VTLGGEGWREPGPSDAPIDYDRVADVYDLYVTSDLDVGFYVAEAGKVKGKVLELMCGTGRVSMPLLEAGVDLTCVDASEGMIARLKEDFAHGSSRRGCYRWTFGASTLTRRSSIWPLSPSTRSPSSSPRATGSSR
jgi:SAM-dependent methyltransferase